MAAGVGREEGREKKGYLLFSERNEKEGKMPELTYTAKKRCALERRKGGPTST